MEDDRASEREGKEKDLHILQRERERNSRNLGKFNGKGLIYSISVWRTYQIKELCCQKNLEAV